MTSDIDPKALALRVAEDLDSDASGIDPESDISWTPTMSFTVAEMRALAAFLREAVGPIEAAIDPSQTPAGDRCQTCGGALTWAHDHRGDLSGLDDGPPLPKRKKPAPKPAEETTRIRAQAWETRRKKYGERGHHGSYSR